jgi:hypothetical protein
LLRLTVRNGRVIYWFVIGRRFRPSDSPTSSTTASSRGALPEVDRSHPSGSLFLGGGWN